MARESLAGVKAELGEKLKRAIDEIASLQTRFAAARSERDEARGQLDALKSENNDLRDALFDAQQELARRAGYMQAIEDSAPPDMQPVKRPSRATYQHANVPTTDLRDYGRDFYERSTTRKWFHR